MKKFAATYLFTPEQKLLKNALLICDDIGTVTGIEQRSDGFREEAGVEYYSGILVPGFVNAHCHLELSHLHHKIEEQTGIGGFIGQINQLRDASVPEREKHMQVADRKMWTAGTAAVGDISNSEISIQTKLKSKIPYHTFVEVFGFHPSRAQRAFTHAEQVEAKFHANKLPASIVPHSPYSVSDPLFRKISVRAVKENGILSIHNQESEGESQFYKEGTGPIADHLQHNLGIDISHWQPSGKSSLEAVLNYLPKANQLLLVHNTFTTQHDLEVLREKRSADNTFLVLCPNSNLYIENTLPPVRLFREHGLNICLGTDSLASNHQLSILSEMVTLQVHFPELKIEELLEWASLNGARALGFENSLGSFGAGKMPGVNLISGLNLKSLKFTQNTRVKRLL